jgi:hypothetical protein
MTTHGSTSTRRPIISASKCAATLVAALLFAVPAFPACRCPKAKACTPATKHPAPAATAAPVQKLTGVFVTLRENLAWPATLDRLRCAGISTIIIQASEENLDHARMLVNLSADYGIAVYLGLHYEGAFNAATSDLPTALAADRALLARVDGWTDAEKKRIGGWYVAEEIHNFNLWRKNTSAAEQWDATLRRADAIRTTYLAPVVAAAHAVAHKPVVASPQFNPVQDGAVLDAMRTGVLFDRIFTGSGIAAIYVQDGLGARNDRERIGCCTSTRSDFEAQAYAYERAVTNALAPAVTVGVNVESFEVSHCVTRTVKADAFRRQLQLAPPGARVVTYELENLLASELWQAYVGWIGAACAGR